MLLDVNFEVNFPFWFRIFGREGKCPTEEFSFVFFFCVLTAPTLLFLLIEQKSVGKVEKVPFYPSGVSRGNPNASTAIKQPYNEFFAVCLLLTQSLKHHKWSCYKIMQNPLELIGFCILKMFAHVISRQEHRGVSYVHNESGCSCSIYSFESPPLCPFPSNLKG